MALISRLSPKLLINNNASIKSNKILMKFCSKALTNGFLTERRYSLSLVHTDSSLPESKYITYDELLKQRNKQARRSIIVQVQSEKSCDELHSYCSEHAKIKQLFHYSSAQMSRHFALMEFENEEDVDKILSITTHTNYDQIIPANTPLLWFRNTKAGKLSTSNNKGPVVQFEKNTTKITKDLDLFQNLLLASTISDQIQILYKMTKLNDAGIRLRFCTAYQIERSFCGLFPHMSVIPFGSSTNGFGKQNCDLDLTLALEIGKSEKLDSRLVFQTKSVLLQERDQARQVMQCIADTMNNFMPGIRNVRKILEARVPIIKFDNVLTSMECDLGMTNMTAHYMSELLYIYGEIDSRLRPLTFAVRKWAKTLNLTHNSPGPWITNFSLSLMVIFYMQQESILPSLNFLRSSASKSDTRTADMCVDCTFLRDISQVPKTKNTNSLEELLYGFFNYFGNFNFENAAICIRAGKPVHKPVQSAIYIVNPLEVDLNVSKNVRFEEVERIRVALRNASWHLDNIDEEKQWGLLSIILDSNTKEYNYLTKDKKPLDIESLFKNDEMHEPILKARPQIPKHKKTKPKEIGRR